MAFFGCVVKQGRATPFVPPPDDWQLHLSAAALPATVPEGKRVSLLAKHKDEQPVIIATLRAGTLDTVALVRAMQTCIRCSSVPLPHPCALHSCTDPFAMHAAICRTCSSRITWSSR
jgi:hypothetical protein